jgi:nucleoside-diphosphate-sugar epimerase
MRIFVTGATGVIGRRVVPALVAGGHQVTAIGRSPEKRAALERAGARAVAVDLFDREARHSALADQQVVVNLATHIPPTSIMFMPGVWRETGRIRREASANLVAAALAGGAERFIQESFGLIYPDQGEAWIDESTPAQPLKFNRSVLDAEASAQRFTEGGGVGVALRFAGFYGPDSPQTFDMIRFVRQGFAPFPGPPRAYFSSISHDDAASAVLAALGLPAGLYNVVDDEPVIRQEFFGSLSAALGVAPPRFLPGWVQFFMGPVGETLGRSLRLSNHKLRAASTWAPRYPSVREGWPAVVQGEQKSEVRS